jgi:nitroimidazol reductase NimA-like FMN-containing flavoprotein (pyridoxamine 5'-phosphate oxidase superfamily)
MSGTIRTLSREECLSRLSKHHVARVSATRGALPVTVPVTYLTECDGVVFGAPLDPGFAQLCDRVVVSFEVGEVSDDPNSAWSVQILGVASALPGSGETARLGLERLSGRQLAVSSHVSVQPVVEAIGPRSAEILTTQGS